MIPPTGSDQLSYTGRSFSPPPDLDAELLRWCDDMMHPEGGWADTPAPIPENESNNHSTSNAGPSHAHHTPAETLTSDEIMAMIMSFSDVIPNATPAPHLHTLEVGHDVHARLSTVRFDSPPPLRRFDSPPPSRSRYTPYKIVDRLAIHRGKHDLDDDAEPHDAGPSVPVSATVPPPVVPAAVPPPEASLPPTTATLCFGDQVETVTVPQVKLRAREDMKRSMFVDSFLISSQERSAKALASIADIVTTFNDRQSPIECILLDN